MKTHHLTLGAIVIVGCGAFFAGRLSAPRSPAGPATGHASATLPSKSQRDESRSPAGPPAHPRPGPRDQATKPTADDLATRMRHAIERGDPVERTRAWLDFIDRLSSDQFVAAVAALRANGVPEDRMGEYAMLLSAWAKIDPLAALDYAKANTGSPFARQTILATWAGYDPDAALRWAEANHEGDGANPWLVGVIKGLATSDPDRATSLLASLPFSRERGQALDAVLPTILAQGTMAARDWVNALRDEQLRNGAMARVAERLAASDPKGTADWLASNPGEAANRSMDDVISTWMKSDQSTAIAYFQNLPAGDVRTNALRGVVNSIALEDPRRAADFLDQHSPDVNDRVVQQFVWHAFREEPSIAAEYIGRITDQGERERMYRRTLDFWLDQDQAAATTWIQANPLPEPVVKHLEQRTQERRQRQQ
jgi:hypothetical protein